MKNFIKDLFTFKWRWNRFKFWIYPLVNIILIIPFLALIAFISLSWYSDEAKSAKVSSDLLTITSTIMVEGTKWKTLESFMLEDNKINFEALKQNSVDFQNPFWWDYLIFIKDNMYQVYWETSNSIIIKWTYYQIDNTYPVSLVQIDWEYKVNGNINGNIAWGIQKERTNFSFIFVIITWLLYFMAFYITIWAYIKRLHDLDRTAWWMLVLFIPFISIGLAIYCGFFKWTEGPNRFGSDPLQSKSQQAESVQTKSAQTEIQAEL